MGRRASVSLGNGLIEGYAFSDLREDLLGLDQGLDVKGGSTVAGREASILNYGLTRDSVRLEKRDVIFVGGGHGWVITLTVPAGQGETFYPLFDAFLGSFELLASAQPTPPSSAG